MKDRLFDRRHERVALALQGGGALGAYEAGVYEALAELGYAPDWLVGVSIGALNAAIIAGNPPERRVERLREFWDLVSSDLGAMPAPPPGPWRTAYQQGSALRATLYGVPGFFAPSVRPQQSIYDTAALHDTLERLVDFDRVNARETRLSVGAVDMATETERISTAGIEQFARSTSWRAARCRRACRRWKSTARSTGTAPS